MTKKFSQINVRYQPRDPRSPENRKEGKQSPNEKQTPATFLTNTATVFSDLSGQIEGGKILTEVRAEGRKHIYTAAKLRIIFNYT